MAVQTGPDQTHVPSDVILIVFIPVAALLVVAGLLQLGRLLVGRLGLQEEAPPTARFEVPPPVGHAPAGAAERAAERQRRQAICSDAERAYLAAATLAAWRIELAGIDPAVLRAGGISDLEGFSEELAAACTATEARAEEAMQHMHDAETDRAAATCAAAASANETVRDGFAAQLAQLPDPGRRRVLWMVFALVVVSALWLALTFWMPAGG